MSYLSIVVHKRVEIIWKEFIFCGRILNILDLVGCEPADRDLHKVITVRPLLFVPKSEGMSDFMYRNPELDRGENYGDDIVQFHLTIRMSLSNDRYMFIKCTKQQARLTIDLILSFKSSS